MQGAATAASGKALRSLVGSAEQRHAFWDPLFREIRQPEWWGGDDQPHPPAPHQPVSTLEEKLAAGTFVVTTEVAPPLSVAPDELTRTLNLLRDYIDAANFTDNPSATPRMSSLACSALALAQGVEPVMQIAARDRTRMGLQAEILGAAALGVRNVLCLTGDHSRMGPAPHGRMDIWDLDSIQMLWILRRMRDAKIWLDGRGDRDAAAPVPRRRRVAVRVHARHAGAARAEEVERRRAVLPEQPGLRRGARSSGTSKRSTRPACWRARRSWSASRRSAARARRG